MVPLVGSSTQEIKESMHGIFPQQSEWRNDRGIANGTGLETHTSALAQARTDYITLQAERAQNSERTW